MGKIIGIIIALIIVVGGGVVLLTKHNNKPSDSTASTSSTSSSSDMPDMSGTSSSPSDSSSASTKPSATNAVTIQNFAFSPADVTVKKGTTVTWTNQDSTAHTVTETDGKTGPGSSDLAQGKSYSFTYNTAGTFKYHCSIHADMTGSVTVTD